MRSKIYLLAGPLVVACSGASADATLNDDAVAFAFGDEIATGVLALSASEIQTTKGALASSGVRI